VYSSIANVSMEPELVQGLESGDVGDFVDALFDGDDDEHAAVVAACTSAVATSLVDNEDRDGASPFNDRVTGSDCCSESVVKPTGRKISKMWTRHWLPLDSQLPIY
jgi:hypothetical protein